MVRPRVRRCGVFRRAIRRHRPHRGIEFRRDLHQLRLRQCEVQRLFPRIHRVRELHVPRLQLLRRDLHRLQAHRQHFRQLRFSILKVHGGDWSFTGFRRAELQGVEFTGVRLREADFTNARCARSTFAGCDFSGSVLHGADFADADLRGSALGEIDPLTVNLRGASVTGDQAAEIARGLGLVVDEV
ncbi:pentapeptide repeat-containing protein [Streptomyces sp. ISL-90]|nr:pentapeptide repeat-containing protein [Streptomyces sp. ISL-90]